MQPLHPVTEACPRCGLSDQIPKIFFLVAAPPPAGGTGLEREDRFREALLLFAHNAYHQSASQSTFRDIRPGSNLRTAPSSLRTMLALITHQPPVSNTAQMARQQSPIEESLCSSPNSMEQAHDWDFPSRASTISSYDGHGTPVDENAVQPSKLMQLGDNGRGELIARNPSEGATLERRWYGGRIGD